MSEKPEQNALQGAFQHLTENMMTSKPEGICTLERGVAVVGSAIDLCTFIRVKKHRTVEGVAPVLTKAFESCATGQEPWPLFVFGPAGTGKTCAALSFIDHYGGVYFTASDFCNTLILARNGDLHWSNGYERNVLDVWSKVKSIEFLVLDELATRKTVSEFHYETIKKIIDIREGRPAMYLSNEGPSTLSKVFDDRVASRLASGTIVKLDGDDRRKGKRFKLVEVNDAEPTPKPGSGR